METPITDTNPILDMNELADQIKNGYEPTIEEVKEILLRLRPHRATAVDEKTGGKKTKTVPMSKDDIMNLFAKKD